MGIEYEIRHEEVMKLANNWAVYNIKLDLQGKGLNSRYRTENGKVAGTLKYVDEISSFRFGIS
jgi:hypothetical protein